MQKGTSGVLELRIRYLIGLVFALILVFFYTQNTLAANGINRAINYQGRLLTSGGVNVADGTYPIKFSLYSADSGGIAIWTSSGTTITPTPINVTVTNGLFSVLLGDQNFQWQNALDLDFNQDSLYLGITIDADLEMTPRKRLSSVPYAFNSEKLQGNYASSTVANTGGALFTLHQTTADEASSQRMALKVITQGTSDANDYLIIGSNGSSDVFSVNRQGHTTTTGNLTVLGNTSLGDTASDIVSFTAKIGSDMIPVADATYSLGSSAFKFNGYFENVTSTNVTSTNLSASLVSSTSFLANPGSVTAPAYSFSGDPDTGIYHPSANTIGFAVNGDWYLMLFQGYLSTANVYPANHNYYDLGASDGTRSWRNIYASSTAFLAGVSSTGMIGPSFNNAFDLGSADFSWKDIYASGTAYIGTDAIVAGQSVCLADGTNCTVGSMPSLAQVTGIGAETIATLQLYGGFLAASSTVTSTLTVLGDTSLKDVTSTSLNVSGSLTSTFAGPVSSTRFIANPGSVTAPAYSFSGDPDTGLYILAGGVFGFVSNGVDVLYGDITNVVVNDHLIPASNNTRDLGYAANNSWRSIYASSTSFLGGVSSTGMIGPSSHNAYDLGSANMSWKDIYASGTVYGGSGSAAKPGLALYNSEGAGGGQNGFYTPAGSNMISVALNGFGPYVQFTGSGYGAMFANAITPIANDVSNIGHSENSWHNIYASGTSYLGTSINFHDDITFNYSPNSMVIGGGNLTLDGSFLPSINNAYDLGYKDGAWKDIYASGTAYMTNVLSSFVTTTKIEFVSNSSYYTGGSLHGGGELFISSNDATYLEAAEINLGDEAGDGIHFLGRVASDILPITNNTLDLGSAISSFRNVYASGTANLANVLSSFVTTTKIEFVSNGAYYDGQTIYAGGGLAIFSEDPTELISSNIYLGNAISDQVYFIGRVGSNVLPSTNNAYDFGSAALSWKNIYASGTAYIATDVVVGLGAAGSSVCLENGTNCPASDAEMVWTDNNALNFIRPSTTTRDVVMGASATASAPFYLDVGAPPFSLQIGRSGNANLFVGTSTYGGGLNTLFTMSGDDLFVQGNIGSASSVYTNGAFVAGAGTTMFGDRFISSSNPVSITTFVPAADATYDLGASTNAFKEIYANTVSAIPSSNVTLSQVTVVETPAATTDIAINGRYMYTVSTSTDTLQVWDISNPEIPNQEGSVSVAMGGDTPIRVAAAGKMVYVHGYDRIYLVDVSTSSAPYVRTIDSGFTQGGDVEVAGDGLYFTYNGILSRAGSLYFSGVQDTVTITNCGTGKQTIAINGDYAYIACQTPNKLNIVNISDSSDLTLITSSTVGTSPVAVASHGRYVYVGNEGGNISIIDVTTPLSPVSAGTYAITGAVNYLQILGRYLYALVDTTGGGQLLALDITRPADPVLRGTFAVPSGRPVAMRISGKYAYILEKDSSKIYVVDLNGMETNALMAGTAEIGELNVLSNGSVANNFSVRGGLMVGHSAAVMGELQIYSDASSTSGGALDVYSDCGSSINSMVATFRNGVDSRIVSIRCHGGVYADSGYVSTGADYAEYFRSVDIDLVSGEVVVFDLANASSVKRAMKADRSQVIGVISANSSVIGNAGIDGEYESDPNYKIVGLLGQLPVKASDSNGAIKVGDQLMAGDNGYAIKATGVGMVLGTALEDLFSTTGSILTMVEPHWSGENVFEASSDTIWIKPQGTATTSTPDFDSYGLTFSGSVWDTASSSVITSNFTLQNNVINSTSSIFTISGANNVPLLTISNIGDVSVKKDLSVGGRLFLGLRSGLASTSTYIFIDDSESPTSTYIATNADGWQTSSTYDYAERFESDQELQPGDLVVADVTGINKIVKSISRDDTVIGIVSTRPGFVTGGHVKGTYPVALAGRVPTRVSTINGAIMAGDSLAPSDMPGIAVKALGSGPIVGIALEAYDKPEEGKISVFVQPGWKGVDLTEQGSETTSFVQSTNVSETITQKRAGLAKIYAGSTEVKITFESLNAYPLINVTPYELMNGSWGIRLVSDKGFTIVLSEVQTFDLIFAWSAEPSLSGYTMSFSDNTSSPYDEMSGLIYGPSVPDETEAATTTAVTSTESSVFSASLPDEPETQTTSTPPIETETSLSTTTSASN